MNATATPASAGRTGFVTRTLPARCILPGDTITHRFLDEPMVVGSTETLGDHIEVYAADTDPDLDTPDAAFKTDLEVLITRPLERSVATETIPASDLVAGDYLLDTAGRLVPVLSADGVRAVIDIRLPRAPRPWLSHVDLDDDVTVTRAILREAVAS